MEYKGHQAGVKSVMNIGGGKIATVDYKANLHVWNVDTGALQQKMRIINCRVTCAAYAGNSRVFSGCSMFGGSNILSDIGTGRYIRQFTEEPHRSFTEEVNSVCVLHGQTRAVTGNFRGDIHIWNLDSGKCIQTLERFTILDRREVPGHSESVTCVVGFDQGRQLVSCSTDATIRIWDVEDGWCTQVLRGHNGSVTSVCVIPNKNRLVSAGWDHTLRVWDMESGECMRVLEDHSSIVSCVAVFSDEQKVVSGSRDGTARVWDIESGECLHTLKGHTQSVDSVCCLSDEQIVTASFDKTVRVWA